VVPVQSLGAGFSVSDWLRTALALLLGLSTFKEIKRMRFSLRNVAALLLVSLFATMFAFGQAEQGTVTGVVTDPTGAVVAGATVTATNTATGFKRTATSSGTGSYVIPALPPAVYQITAEKSGFAAFKTQVKVNVGGRQTVDVALAASGGSTTIEVTGEAG